MLQQKFVRYYLSLIMLVFMAGNPVKAQDSLNLKMLASKYLNPYVSVGIGTDRLLIAPEAGIKLGPVKGQVGFWTNLETSDYINFLFEVNVLKLEPRNELTPYISLGYLYRSGNTGDHYYSNTSDAHGALLGMNFTKNGTRSNFGIRLGYRKSEFVERNWTDDPNNPVVTESNSEGIVIGFNLNWFLFKMRE